MPKARKMVNLAIEETSGVDHPAHLHEGWLVIKAANPTEVEELVAELTETSDKVLETEAKEEDSMAEEITKSAEEQLAEAQEALKSAELRISELESALSKSENPEETSDSEESADDVLKSAPEAVRVMVENLQKSADEARVRAEQAEAELNKSRDEAADAEAIAKAKEWANLSLDAEVVGKALRRLADVDSDLAKSVEEVLTSVNAQAESANIFAELGKSVVNGESSAFDRLTALAKNAVAANEAPTFEQAFANVTVQNPELYAQYVKERGV